MGLIGHTLSANQSFDTFTVAAAIYTMYDQSSNSDYGEICCGACARLSQHLIMQINIAVQYLCQWCMQLVNG